MQPVCLPRVSQGPSRYVHTVGRSDRRRDGKVFRIRSMEAYISAVVGRNARLSAAGGLKYLKENGLWRDSQAKPTYRSYEAQGFNTPSRKVEIASKAMEAAGAGVLPEFPVEAGSGDTLSLVLLSVERAYVRPNRVMHVAFGDSSIQPGVDPPERASALAQSRRDEYASPITSER